MTLNDWTSVLVASYREVFSGVAAFVPKLIVAIIVLLLGWLIAAALAKVVAQIIKSIKLDSALTAAGLDKLMSKAGYALNSGKFIGELVRWFVIVVFLMATFDILGLTQVNTFLQGVVINYIPQVVAAVLILLVAVVVSDFLKKTVVASTKAAGMSHANMLGSITKWAILIFAVLIALSQLGIGAIFMQTLFTGLIVALALGFGIAFGLGGKDAAARFIEKLRAEASERD